MFYVKLLIMRPRSAEYSTRSCMSHGESTSQTFGDRIPRCSTSITKIIILYIWARQECYISTICRIKIRWKSQNSI